MQKDLENNANKDDINSLKKLFLLRVKFGNYNIEIHRTNFQVQPIYDVIEQYDEVRKKSAGQGDDYTTGCFLDYANFKDNYKLIAADLCKQEALDDDSRAFRGIVFTGGVRITAIIYYILEQSKETILEF